MNMILLILEISISFSLIIILYKFKKEEGLTIWLIVSLILSSLMSIKTIEINNVDIAIGLGISASTYIVSNIIIQRKGLEYCQNLYKLLIIISSLLVIILILTSMFACSNYNINTGTIYDFLVVSNIKMVIVNIISVIVALVIGNIVYYELRKIKNKIWISNILSTLILCFVEVILFAFLAYITEYSLYITLMITVIRYIIKVIILIAGTPIIYWVNNYK